MQSVSVKGKGYRSFCLSVGVRVLSSPPPVICFSLSDWWRFLSHTLFLCAIADVKYSIFTARLVTVSVTGFEEAESVFRSFVALIRSNDNFCNSYIIYIGEKNTGLQSSCHEFVLETTHSHYVIRDKPEDRAGVWTSKIAKPRYALALRTELTMGALVFMKSFLVVGTTEKNKLKRQLFLLQEFFSQLLRCRPTQDPNVKDTASGTISWSGKLNAEGKRDSTLNDDIVLTLAMGIWWAKRFMMKAIVGVDYTQFGGLY